MSLPTSMVGTDGLMRLCSYRLPSWLAADRPSRRGRCGQDDRAPKLPKGVRACRSQKTCDQDCRVLRHNNSCTVTPTGRLGDGPYPKKILLRCWGRMASCVRHFNAKDADTQSQGRTRSPLSAGVDHEDPACSFESCFPRSYECAYEHKPKPVQGDRQ